MNSTARRLCVVFIFFFLVACSPAGTAEVTAPTAPADTSTPQPPTATFVPPAASPTPIPAADFTLADIAGTWFREDPDRGSLYFIINADGSYIASHGTPDGIVHSGEFTLDGRIFTFVNGWDCSPLGETAGQYVLRLSGEGKYLLFAVLADECPDRPSAFKSVRWDRVTTVP